MRGPWRVLAAVTRIFHYEGADPVPPAYFSDAHYQSDTLTPMPSPTPTP